MASRSEVSLQRNKQKRQAKFAATEAARPPEERLMNRQDFDAQVNQQISLSQEHALAQMQDWFVEFLLDENVQICHSEMDARRFFQKNGDRPITTSLLRQFLQYLVDSRVGRSPENDDRLHYNTVHSYITLLSSSAKRSGVKIEIDVVDSCHDWIDGNLIPNGLVTIKSKKKELTLSADITDLLGILFSIEYMVTFRSTRDVLQLSLFINMAVDSCGRIKGDGEIVLRGLVRFENLKKRKSDPPKIKTIPLRLLPLSLALEDTLRQLIILALIDNVFVNIRRWGDFNSLDPGPRGSLVKFNESMMSQAVFRNTRKHCVTNAPLKSATIAFQLRALGRAAGLEGPLLSYTFRRGVAYVLATNVSADDRCALMGHNPGSSTYWNHYRNTTSTVDFQAIFRQQEIEDVSMLSSISINKRCDAPRCLSSQGFRRINSSLEIKSVLEPRDALLDQIIGQYGSVAKAASQDPVLSRAYAEANLALKLRRQKMVKYAYAAEYKAHFDSDCPTIPEKDIVESSSSDSMLASAEGEQSDDEDQFETLISKETHPENIDPSLLLDEGAQSIKAFLSTDSLIENGRKADDILDSHDSDSAQDDRIDSVDRIPRQIGASKTLIMPRTVVDELPTVFANNGRFQTPGEISDYLVQAFNHLHIADAFYPGQEPRPGTFECRFCNEPLESAPEEHARLCQRAEFIKVANQRLDIEFPIDNPCTWLMTLGANRGRRCGKVIKDLLKLQSHLNTHRRSGSEKGEYPCRFGDCATATTPVVFYSDTTWRNHLGLVHKISVACKDKEKIPARHAASHFIWCGFCFQWLSQLDDDLEGHAAGHRDILQATIETAGYKGCSLSNKWLHPPMCPFCVHDDSLEVCVRFRCFEDRKDQLAHILSLHIDSVDPPDHCPASGLGNGYVAPTCSDTSVMTRDQLVSHLETSHLLQLRTVKKRVRTKKGIDAPSERANKKGRQALEAKDANTGLTTQVERLTGEVDEEQESSCNDRVHTVGGEKENM